MSAEARNGASQMSGKLPPLPETVRIYHAVMGARRQLARIQWDPTPDEAEKARAEENLVKLETAHAEAQARK